MPNLLQAFFEQIDFAFLALHHFVHGGPVALGLAGARDKPEILPPAEASLLLACGYLALGWLLLLFLCRKKVFLKV